MPLKLKEPSKIFTCSLTDFFLADLDGFRNEAWDIIRRCPQHTFQILTKRPENIADRLPDDWGDGWPNVWLGTSVGSQDSIERIAQLVNVHAPNSAFFLSLEPLHGPIDLYKAIMTVREMEFNVMPAIDWVIVGGESGHDTGKYRYRPCELKWIEDIVSFCKREGIAVFVKQLGTHLSKEMKLSDRHGGDINEFPEHLQIREFPVFAQASL
jgi:protein gp37